MIKYIDIHTHRTQEEGISLLSYNFGMGPEPPAGSFYSAGVHPWTAGECDIDASLEYLRTFPIAAVGEIGLDYAIEKDRSRQRELFEAQIGIAAERGLPVVIHCVKAYNDVLHLLKDYRLRGVIFHGFTGSPELAIEITGRGYYLSFGERTFGSNKTIEALKISPLNSLFAETDESLTGIDTIYKRMAKIKQVPEATLATAIEQNFNRLFDER